MKLLKNKKGQGMGSGKTDLLGKVLAGEGIIPNWFRDIFKKYILGIILFLGRLIAVILLIGALAYGVWYIYNVNQTGIGGVALEHGTAAAKEQVPKIVESVGMTNVYQAMFAPETMITGYGFESDIEENENNQNLGVRITDLRPADKFFEGDTITIDGTIKAQSLTEPLTIKVFCELEDFNVDTNNKEQKIPAQVNGIGARRNEITLYPGPEETILATCEFENAATFKQNEEDKVITAKTAKMTVTYDFKTLAMHKTYFLGEEESLALKKRGEDPFETYQIKDPQLQADNTIRSRATAGPLKIAIGTIQSQPFAQSQSVAFAVTVANNAMYGGNIKTLKEIKLHMPPNTILESDPEYGNEGLLDQCAFESTGESDEDGFKLYSVRDGELSNINKDCEDITLATAHLTEEQCIKFYKGDINLRCKFKTTEIPEEGLYYDIIRADAEYIYETEKSKAINILRLPESGVIQGGEAIA